MSAPSSTTPLAAPHGHRPSHSGGGDSGGGEGRLHIRRESSVLLADYLDAAGELPPAAEAVVPLTPGRVKTEDSGGRPYVGRLPLLTKLAYGAPALATTSLSFLVSVYLVDFYVSLGAPLAFLTFFTAAARSLDVITDPLMGWLSDRTRTRWGRRRVYQLSGCAVYGILFAALFTPPHAVLPPAVAGRLAPGDPRIAHVVAWFAGTYFFFYLADTWCNVPYEALGPELTDDYTERSRVFFIAKLFNQAGMLAAAALPAVAAAALRSRGAARVGVECAGLAVGATKYGDKGVFKLAPPEYAWPGGDGTCEAARACVGGGGNYCFAPAAVHAAAAATTTRGGAPVPARFEAAIGHVKSACAAALVAASGPDPPRAPPCTSLIHAPPPCPPGTPCATFTRYAMSALAAQRGAYAAISASFGLYYVCAALLTAARVKERPLPPDAVERVPLVPSMMRAFKNRAFRPLLVAWALEGLGLSSLLTMAPFFVRYVVESDGPAAVASGHALDPTVCLGAGVMTLLVVAMAVAPGWLAASRRWGKFRVWLVVSGMAVAANLLFLVPLRGQPYLTIALMAVNGFPIGGAFLTHSILADVIDYDQFLHGARCEASFTVFATIIPKLLAIPASALPLAAINLLGFVPPVDGVSQPQSARVRHFVAAAFVAMPVLSASVSLAFKARFPIRTPGTAASIQAGIAAHDGGRAAVDPLTGRRTHLLRLATAAEKDDVWRYECFSTRALDRMLASGSAGGLVRGAAAHVAAAALLLAGALATTALTSRFIADARLSAVPVLAAILSGVFLSYLCVSVARLGAARALGRGEGGAERHRALVPRVRARVARLSSVGGEARAASANVELGRREGKDKAVTK